MKKFKYLIALLFLTQLLASANYNDIYIADIQYDWIDKTMVEKEAIISEIRDIIFEDDVTERKDLKSQFKDILKDKDHLDHYYAASAGYEEYGDYNISAFYYGKRKHIYMYALQDKKDLSKAYYYDALGRLKYVSGAREEALRRLGIERVSDLLLHIPHFPGHIAGGEKRNGGPDQRQGRHSPVFPHDDQECSQKVDGRVHHGGEKGQHPIGHHPRVPVDAVEKISRLVVL